jgi:hypothetical protein
MEKSIDRWNWVRDLVQSEERMEESGIVDMSIGFDNEKTLVRETLRFLEHFKNEITEASNAFNDLKVSPLGRIKIYGIAKTQADFMLFRNGYKMIFSMRGPGLISVRFNFLGPQQYLSQIPSAMPTAPAASGSSLMEENLFVAKRGPFQDLVWTFNDQPIQLTAAVRFHISLFIRESAK